MNNIFKIDAKEMMKSIDKIIEMEKKEKVKKERIDKLVKKAQRRR